ncbi:MULTISPECIES: ArsR/SmtB family transcription factor [Actibacterium]|uniref:DNA-binding transcriptional ArsR family regulator n=1 Tax=Actibacterium naphthalenivorans TaxID=1614693 RepID=A0A840CAG4_9RHOB|nr:MULTISPECIES: winged helix-turn-helix domain-containing protein [Actibacterium]ALG90439.1 ArsR family transcriptional regulator [Actibacterium sp. EMB200-NS6]MBB4022385.1 DNA-binding transcriptional ArsR family regulator [Actibacterium naphthalenivorans]
MREGPDISRISSLIGDPARASMLTALMAGKALTASELAREAGVTVQTASSHLGKLERGGLLRLRKQGRHKYFSLAGDDVAHVLEALMGLAADAGHLRTRPGPKNAALREARVCYNHLAGDMGTRLFDSMMARQFLSQPGDDLTLSPGGVRFVREFGIDLDALAANRAPLCRECLDWSERRSHLAGSLGRALLHRIEELGWARRDRETRAVLFTPRGRNGFEELIAAP